MPQRILLVRFHALGDVALTLPCATALRARLPGSRIDYLTCTESAPLVRSLDIFNNILEIPARTGSDASTILEYGAFAREQQYDLIIDVQRNRGSRWIRRIASPEAWAEFDRYSLYPAAERVLQCFHRSGFGDLVPEFSVPIREAVRRDAAGLLDDAGRDSNKPLIVLNPAGLWQTRNWPTANYVAMAKLWRSEAPVQFIFLGTERIRSKAQEIITQLGEDVIDLTGRTNVGEALAILTLASAVITEDSGLMHMSWAAGVPTVALFGSTDHRKSAPVGAHVRVFDSGDLPCGNCQEEICRFGDVHCLTRRSPVEVFRAARMLISETARIGVVA